MNSIDFQKQLVRKEVKEKLKNISASEKEIIDNEIYKLFIELNEYKKCTTVFAYYSVGREIDTFKIISEALKDGKKVALPVCTENGFMDFYEITGFPDLVPGEYNIPAPDTEKCRIIYPNERSICIVPSATFSRTCQRLGKGGGYYDRYFDKHEIFKIGLCNESVIYESLPVDQYDVSVDIVLTQTGIIKREV